MQINLMSILSFYVNMSVQISTARWPSNWPGVEHKAVCKHKISPYHNLYLIFQPSPIIGLHRAAET